MSTCKIKKMEHGYGWDGENRTNCIMAIYCGNSVDRPDLWKLCEAGTITETELDAIGCFDGMYGSDTDLGIIKALAKRLKVKLETIK